MNNRDNNFCCCGSAKILTDCNYLELENKLKEAQQKQKGAMLKCVELYEKVERLEQKLNKNAKVNDDSNSELEIRRLKEKLNNRLVKIEELERTLIHYRITLEDLLHDKETVEKLLESNQNDKEKLLKTIHDLKIKEQDLLMDIDKLIKSNAMLKNIIEQHKFNKEEPKQNLNKEEPKLMSIKKKYDRLNVTATIQRRNGKDKSNSSEFKRRQTKVRKTIPTSSHLMEVKIGNKSGKKSRNTSTTNFHKASLFNNNEIMKENENKFHAEKSNNENGEPPLSDNQNKQNLLGNTSDNFHLSTKFENELKDKISRIVREETAKCAESLFFHRNFTGEMNNSNSEGIKKSEDRSQSENCWELLRLMKEERNYYYQEYQLFKDKLKSANEKNDKENPMEKLDTLLNEKNQLIKELEQYKTHYNKNSSYHCYCRCNAPSSNPVKSFDCND